VKHHCHAKGCDTPVPPSMLMCKHHWAQVPVALRMPVIRNYRRGQCDDKRPSREWIKAARAAIESIPYEPDVNPAPGADEYGSLD
jgi:hypothetical protein